MLRCLFTRMGFYINDSLRNLITTGQGQPNQTEDGNREHVAH
jgi:hypothetical protein